MALALVIVPQASAKGPVVLCGTGGCVPLGSDAAGLRFSSGDGAHVDPVPAGPFFKLRFGAAGGSLGYWVPKAGIMRTGLQSGYGSWTRPSAEESALLADAASTLRPFAAPRHASVTVGSHGVRRGTWTYLRLFTMGTPVTRAVGAKSWIRLLVWTGDSPWSAIMWISKSNSFLDRGGGQIVQLSPKVADRIRHRLPLTG
jgi:hypothetical protein